MKSQISISILFTIGFLIIQSCSTVPLTGRQQLNLVPNSTIIPMSFQEYDAFLEANSVSKSKSKTEMVRSVGVNVQKAVEKYFADHNLSSALEDYKWEFNLIESDELNAWCMPGGKVVVYTGILKVTQDETGLAVVMGHEIAHAIANHGSERMSQSLATQMGGMALSVALEEQPEETQQLWMMAYGLGAQYGAILPYSRLHESEADHLGLIFMSMAGYDPNAAVAFWQRMAKMKSGQSPPEFLSTHPSDETRISEIKGWMPEAMKYYKTAE
ncbi:MAG: M48 family metallopeptidase [Bacteroidales bacterium]|nr:M48 family metallopeptidase [Bacteroidales bacterium]